MQILYEKIQNEIGRIAQGSPVWMASMDGNLVILPSPSTSKSKVQLKTRRCLSIEKSSVKNNQEGVPVFQKAIAINN